MKIRNATAQENPIHTFPQLEVYNDPTKIPNDGSAVPAAGVAIDIDAAKQLIAPDTTFHSWSSDNASFPVVPNDLAVGYVAGRPDYIQSIETYIGPQAPLLHISRPPGMIPNNFILAVQETVDKFPDAKWYYICDDDNYVMVNRLRMLASRYNPDEFHYIGTHHGGNGWTGMGWVCGGPGVLISGALGRKMRQGNCEHTHSDVGPGDVKVAFCAADAMRPNHHVTHADGMWQDNPAPGSTELPPGAISLHHITPAVFNAVGEYVVQNHIQ